MYTPTPNMATITSASSQCSAMATVL